LATFFSSYGLLATAPVAGLAAALGAGLAAGLLTGFSAGLPVAGAVALATGAAGALAAAGLLAADWPDVADALDAPATGAGDLRRGNVSVLAFRPVITHCFWNATLSTLWPAGKARYWRLQSRVSKRSPSVRSIRHLRSLSVRAEPLASPISAWQRCMRVGPPKIWVLDCCAHAGNSAAAAQANTLLRNTEYTTITLSSCFYFNDFFHKACKVTFFEAFFQHLGSTHANSA
jgi:hypothetical protein